MFPIISSLPRQVDSIIYFRVDDVRTVNQVLKARGVEFLAAPHMIHKHDDGTEEWVAAFEVNEGYRHGATPRTGLKAHKARWWMRGHFAQNVR